MYLVYFGFRRHFAKGAIGLLINWYWQLDLRRAKWKLCIYITHLQSKIRVECIRTSIFLNTLQIYTMYHLELLLSVYWNLNYIVHMLKDLSRSTIVQSFLTSKRCARDLKKKVDIPSISHAKNMKWFYYTIPFGSSLFFAFWGIIFQLLKLLCLA